jgi:hypothetical protein
MEEKLIQSSVAGSKPPSILRPNPPKGFFERHGAAIQTVSTMLGVVIAGLMLWSLVISRRQLESSIEPRLDIACAPHSAELGGAIAAETNSWNGMLITNALMPNHLTSAQQERLIDTLASYTRISIRNAGAVAISDVQILMRLEAGLDGSGTVTNAVYESCRQTLSTNLRPNETVVHDFGSEPALARLVRNPHAPTRSRVVCYLIGYRRSIDMKPKFRLICFDAWRFLPASDRAFAVPLGIAGLGSYPNSVLLPRSVKSGIMKFLEQLDVVSPTDDQ